MPITVVDLCNMALAHLRQRPVEGDETSVIGDTPEATNCRRFYETAMREAFRAFDWPFARQYSIGVLVPNAGVQNWKYAYAIPEGAEIVRAVVQNSRTEAKVRFRIMRTVIAGVSRQAVFTNEANAWLASTAYLPDPATYPADFIEFASLTLAAHLAMPITGKAELMTGMRKLAEDAGKRAALAATSGETEDEGEDPTRATARTQQVPVDVANAALALLGEDAIVSFGDRTRQGDMVRRFYRQALDVTFRAWDWPFARIYLAGVPAVVPAGAAGWTSAYQYPPDIYDVRYIQRIEPGLDMRFQIRRQGGPDTDRLILTKVQGATFVCTGYVSDPSEYPAEFISVAAARLAAMMALPLTGKPEMSEAMAKNAEREAQIAFASMSRTEAPDMGADPEPDAYTENGTHTQIANLALGMLGQSPIMAFSEHTKAGDLCRRFYSQALGSALRLFDWPFARVIVNGVKANAPVVPNWKYAYAMPDCAALRYVMHSTDSEAQIPYQVLRFGVNNATRYIYTNEDNARFVVTASTVNASEWSKDFTQLFAANR